MSGYVSVIIYAVFHIIDRKKEVLRHGGLADFTARAMVQCTICLHG